MFTFEERVETKSASVNQYENVIDFCHIELKFLPGSEITKYQTLSLISF